MASTPHTTKLLSKKEVPTLLLYKEAERNDAGSEWEAKARTAKNEMEEAGVSVKEVGLKTEEDADRTRWREGVRAIAEGMRCIRPSTGTRKKPD